MFFPYLGGFTKIVPHNDASEHYYSYLIPIPIQFYITEFALSLASTRPLRETVNSTHPIRN